MSSTSGGSRSGWSRLADADMIAALAAVVIGVAAIVVAVVQVRIMREEQHAAVWPRLLMGQGYDQGRRVEFIVANPGVGPAVIRSVRASVDGRSVQTWGAIFNSLTGQKRATWSVSLSGVRRGMILPAGGNVTAVALVDTVFADRIFRQMERLRFDVCYCSVYDRCWLASTRDTSLEPRPVRRCAPARVEFSGN